VDYTTFYGKGNENHLLGTGFFIHEKIVPEVRRVETVSDTMSCIVLRGGWCNIILPDVHVLTVEKCSDSKDSLYKELEQVFDHFPKYHMKILLGGFNAELGREDIFKPTTGNQSLHQDSNDNGVRVVKFKKNEVMNLQVP
jgi:hypothetical protein